MRAFSDTLDSIPMALVENSGLSSIQTVANIKSQQIAESNSRLGIDCRLEIVVRLMLLMTMIVTLLYLVVLAILGILLY